MARPNYELKAQVIGNGCAKIQRKLSLTEWKYNQLYESISSGGEINEKVIEDLTKKSELLEELKNQISEFTDEEINEAEKVNYAAYKRTKRLKDRILELLLNNGALFLTLTFTDTTLNKTTQETRKKYVTRFLKEQCDIYVANIDFGKQKGREHYHAVVIPKEMIDHSKWSRYGSIDWIHCYHKTKEENYEESSKRLAKYVSKLTNHAIKETVKSNRIIYSRNTFTI